MQAHEPLDLAPERARYPLLLAVAWVAACAALDWSTAGAWHIESAYLPVVAWLAWYYGGRVGLLFALLATAAASVVDVAFGPALDAAALAIQLAATACVFAVPAWLAGELGRSGRRLAMVLTTDADSGLLNRSGLLSRINDELLRTERFGGDLSILAVGINGLARFTEEHGLERAQRLLFGFSESLRVVARRTDVIARIDKDEFAVLLPATGASTALAVAERHERILGEWLRSQGPELSCSIGHRTSPVGRALGGPALLACAVAHMQEQRPAAGRTAVKPVLRESPAAQFLVTSSKGA
jgi:diguanylate cyclase (GGDEF)-like protein